MTKIALVIAGVIAILFGAVDLLADALMLHSRILIGIGVVTVAVAGIMHWWQKFILPMTALAFAVFCATNVSAMTVEQALTPPPVTPMIHRSLVTGTEAWIWILGAVAILAIFLIGLMLFLRSCDERRLSQK